jgi:hypothetical protein
MMQKIYPDLEDRNNIVTLKMLAKKQADLSKNIPVFESLIPIMISY